MTRDQADQVLALGRAEIAKWVAKLRPLAGQNAVVDGNTVSMIKLPPAAPPEQPVQTWEWKLFGSVQGSLTGGGDPVEIDVQNELAGRVVRSTLGLLTTSFWTANTQLLDTPQTDAPNLVRSYELTLTARGIPQGESVAVTSGFTPPDVVLTLEEYDSSSGPTAGEVVETITLSLRSGQVARSFTQRTPGRITSLRLVAVKKPT